MKINGLQLPKGIEPARAAPVAARPETRNAASSSEFDSSALPVAPRETAIAPRSSPSGLGFETREPTRRISLDEPAGRAALATADALLSKLASAPGRTFVPSSIETDALGQTHVRMTLMQDGVAVFGKQVIVHLDRSGQPLSATGIDRLPTVSTQPLSAPRISEDSALQIASSLLPGAPDSAAQASRVKLPVNGALVDAFRIELSSSEPPSRITAFVDARTGELLQSFDRLAGVRDTAPAPSSGEQQLALPEGEGDDHTLYSGDVSIHTRENEDGTHTLADDSRGHGITILDTQNTTDPKDAIEIRDNDGHWGDPTDNPRYKAGVDVLYAAETTYDFYKETFGRDSIDNAGEAITAHINLGKSNYNAYWNGKVMKFGPGDKEHHSGPLVNVDTIGHELTHGVTERTADLVYSGESGGLNEAWSDIMGAGVEWFASQRNPAVHFDWKVAAEPWTPGVEGDALRYFDDPTRDGKSIDNYRNYAPRMDMHHSSGIANNAFFMLVNGGTNKTSGLGVENAIGIDKALQVFYRALTVYMTPDTDFSQARAATLSAAADLYGADSPEAAAVAQAWTAVGVENPPTGPNALDSLFARSAGSRQL